MLQSYKERSEQHYLLLDSQGCCLIVIYVTLLITVFRVATARKIRVIQLQGYLSFANVGHLFDVVKYHIFAHNPNDAAPGMDYSEKSASDWSRRQSFVRTSERQGKVKKGN
jgi:hypothetical protein